MNIELRNIDNTKINKYLDDSIRRSLEMYLLSTTAEIDKINPSISLVMFETYNHIKSFIDSGKLTNETSAYLSYYDIILEKREYLNPLVEYFLIIVMDLYSRYNVDIVKHKAKNVSADKPSGLYFEGDFVDNIKDFYTIDGVYSHEEFFEDCFANILSKGNINFLPEERTKDENFNTQCKKYLKDIDASHFKIVDRINEKDLKIKEMLSKITVTVPKSLDDQLKKMLVFYEKNPSNFYVKTKSDIITEEMSDKVMKLETDLSSLSNNLQIFKDSVSTNSSTDKWGMTNITKFIKQFKEVVIHGQKTEYNLLNSYLKNDIVISEDICCKVNIMIYSIIIFSQLGTNKRKDVLIKGTEPVFDLGKHDWDGLTNDEFGKKFALLYNFVTEKQNMFNGILNDKKFESMQTDVINFKKDFVNNSKDSITDFFQSKVLFGGKLSVGDAMQSIADLVFTLSEPISVRVNKNLANTLVSSLKNASIDLAGAGLVDLLFLILETPFRIPTTGGNKKTTIGEIYYQLVFIKKMLALSDKESSVKLDSFKKDVVSESAEFKILKKSAFLCYNDGLQTDAVFAQTNSKFPDLINYSCKKDAPSVFTAIGFLKSKLGTDTFIIGNSAILRSEINDLSEEELIFIYANYVFTFRDAAGSIMTSVNKKNFQMLYMPDESVYNIATMSPTQYNAFMKLTTDGKTDLKTYIANLSTVTGISLDNFTGILNTELNSFIAAFSYNEKIIENVIFNTNSKSDVVDFIGRYVPSFKVIEKCFGFSINMDMFLEFIDRLIFNVIDLMHFQLNKMKIDMTNMYMDISFLILKKEWYYRAQAFPVMLEFLEKVAKSYTGACVKASKEVLIRKAYDDLNKSFATIATDITTPTAPTGEVDPKLPTDVTTPKDPSRPEDIDNTFTYVPGYTELIIRKVDGLEVLILGYDTPNSFSSKIEKITKLKKTIVDGVEPTYSVVEELEKIPSFKKYLPSNVSLVMFSDIMKKYFDELDDSVKQIILKLSSFEPNFDIQEIIDTIGVSSEENSTKFNEVNFKDIDIKKFVSLTNMYDVNLFNKLKIADNAYIEIL